MRSGTVNRKTAETDIDLSLCIDGSGESSVDTGVGFLDHMLTLFARHSGFNLAVTCRGDVHVDDHHSVEDIGICLGTAFASAIGDKRGISRYGSALIPMDEALVLAAVDVSGRGKAVYEAQIPCQKVGTFDTELAEEFFESFARFSGVTLHIRQISGANGHHIIEGMFKAFARALSAAVQLDERFADMVPSTKGVL